MTVLFLLILGLWLAVSVVNQLCPGRSRLSRRLAEAVARYDVCFLIPDYRYFAPDPPAYDLDIVYRDRLVDGSLTPWRPIVRSSRTPWRAMWNPAKRKGQVLSDRSRRLLRQIRWSARGVGRVAEVLRSDEYASLVRCVTAASHSRHTCHAQFAVVVSTGFDTRTRATPAFVSPFFAV
jgi:hypothetical protein